MAGYYGKVPAKGDFVSKGLSREVMDKFHEFFSAGLQSTIDQLEGSWLEYYSVGPIWYFFIQPEVVNKSAWLGIWMPSVDRVGRHFPLLIMEPIENDISSLADLGYYQHSILEFENMILDTLESDIDTNSVLEGISKASLAKSKESKSGISSLLNAELNEEAPVPETNSELEQFLLDRIFQLEGKVQGLQDALEELKSIDSPELPPVIETFSSNTGKNLAFHIKDIQDLPFEDDFNSHSIWFSAGNERVSPQLVIYEKLPTPENFSQFLTGIKE